MNDRSFDEEPHTTNQVRKLIDVICHLPCGDRVLRVPETRDTDRPRRKREELAMANEAVHNVTEVEARTPLTNQNWNDFPYGLSPSGTAHWDVKADLSYQLRDHNPHLGIDACRVLVHAAASGLPVVLTWDNVWERTVDTVIITNLHPTNASIMQWGHSMTLRLGSIWGVDTPERISV